MRIETETEWSVNKARNIAMTVVYSLLLLLGLVAYSLAGRYPIAPLH